MPELQLPSLYLLVDAHGIDYFVYNRDADSRVGHLNIDTDAAPSTLKAIEDTVYDNPFLLDDYRQCRIVVRAPHFSLLPPEYAHRDDDARRAHRATATGADRDIIVAACRDGQPVVAWEMEKDVYHFLQRSFNSPPVVHHLIPLIDRCRSLSEIASTRRLYINLHDDHTTDIIALDSEARLTLANSVDTPSAPDAAYFALNTWRLLGYDAQADQLVISGDSKHKSELTELLRKYIAHVDIAMPPADVLKLGVAAAKAPLELTLTAIEAEKLT